MNDKQWEEVATHTYRLKVEGGWLYRYSSADSSCTMVFVRSR